MPDKSDYRKLSGEGLRGHDVRRWLIFQQLSEEFAQADRGARTVPVCFGYDAAGARRVWRGA